jgi:hypothetical protein
VKVKTLDAKPTKEAMSIGTPFFVNLPPKKD